MVHLNALAAATRGYRQDTCPSPSVTAGAPPTPFVFPLLPPGDPAPAPSRAPATVTSRLVPLASGSTGHQSPLHLGGASSTKAAAVAAVPPVVFTAAAKVLDGIVSISLARTLPPLSPTRPL